MNINILAGGPSEFIPSLEAYQNDKDVWIGVDKGVYTLLSNNIQPTMAFGDFDSVTKKEMQLIEEKVEELKRFHPEKDETDLELALDWALKQLPETIRIFGATGGRIDHFLANIQLLIKPMQNDQFVHVEIIDQKNLVYLRSPGSYTVQKKSHYKYISFLPISMEVSGITLEGFKYPLTNRNLPIGSTLCISNELIIDNGHFSFLKGILLVVRSND
ncbi:thiamine pyrophosphokinase [Cytobacillus eiseniae]|uniref:Thiamine diphosphokinase n=1 Tax=Cytobacillus eiseniae TaxID=762947 RepID=A0ABS4RCE4_9BACI|nr:thiamine diphosphokinase [Cytobacillus eiseniae]MBP2240086.1 thiamine pyrophosphokinase [Cytobacillus eiseniae]